MHGLYLHIPFCGKKCHYCDFVITTDRTLPMRERFFAALEKEILHARERYGALRFESLYLGGGTPSVLSAAEMERLLKSLRTAFEFIPGFEFTCEMNPEDADAEKLQAFRALGVNRVSLGVQSLNDSLLETTGRIHNAAAVSTAVESIQRAGISNISMDLMLRLPGQTAADVKETVEKIISLGPGQVSVYDLSVHPETVFGRRQGSGKLALPDEMLHGEMYECTENLLTRAGFVQYELTNFARPGFESRHNMIYWKNREYLGLGPGAFSYMEGVRYQLAPTVQCYLEKCEAGDWTRDSEDVLTAEKKEIETLLTGLRLKQGIDLGQFKIIRGRLERQIQTLGAGLVERRGDTLTLAPRGKFLAEAVFAELVGE